MQGVEKVREAYERDVLVFAGLSSLREGVVRVNYTSGVYRELAWMGVSGSRLDAVAREWKASIVKKLMDVPKEQDDEVIEQ